MMMLSIGNKAGLTLVLCGFAATVNAGTGWNEAVSGDLSNDGLTPTAVAVSLGSNVVLGTAGNPGTGVDRDYFSITVPPGAALSQIKLLGNTTVSGGASFFAIQLGPQLTVTPTGGGVQNLLGFVHYATADIGTDLLPAVVLNFTGSLPSGTYSLWVQDTGGPVSYGFDFVITPVDAGTDAPLPSWAITLFGALLIGGAAIRLRRRNLSSF